MYLGEASVRGNTVVQEERFTSFVLQALIDHEYQSMNTMVGWPRSMHDAHILSSSEVYAKRGSGCLVPEGTRHQ